MHGSFLALLVYLALGWDQLLPAENHIYLAAYKIN